jgi:hypothetical protein
VSLSLESASTGVSEPGAAGFKDLCKRTFRLFGGDKNPGPSRPKLAVIFPKS